MHLVRSQIWQGTARYMLVHRGQWLDPWAPYAMADLIAQVLDHLASDADPSFEEKAIAALSALAEQGRPLLYLLMDELMRTSLTRTASREELTERARSCMRTHAPGSDFAQSEYAFVRHLIAAGPEASDVTSADLQFAVQSGHRYAAGVHAIQRIHADIATAFEATRQAAQLGSRSAPLRYVEVFFKQAPKARDPERLRELLLLVALQDDPVCLFDLAVTGEPDLVAMSLAALQSSDLARSAIEKDPRFAPLRGLVDSSDLLCQQRQAGGEAQAQLLRTALLSSWQALGL